MNAIVCPIEHDLIARALAEDIGRGDVTTEACIAPATMATGNFIARQAGTIAGLPVVREVFRQLDPAITITFTVPEGASVTSDTVVLACQGPARGILTGERVALNFAGRLSGIATLTARCVAALNGTSARLVDTRKTTPGLRRLEKYAVAIGGGQNHRFGLDDGILIKDNHIIASGGITAAIINARRSAHHLLRIEVECETIEHVRAALAARADALLLDNMPLDQLATAVTLIRAQRPETIIEASGNIGTDLAKLRAVAETGVDLISSGALTHSAPNFDISLEFVQTQDA